MDMHANNLNGTTELTLEAVNNIFANDRLFVSVFLLTISFVGLTANIVILYVYMFQMPKWKESSRFFVPFLAINDAIVCIAGPTFRVYLNFNFVVPKSNIFCRSHVYFICVFVMVSSMILLLIAIDRFLCIYYNGLKRFKLKSKELALIAIILTAFLSKTPVWAYFGELEITYDTHGRHDIGNLTLYQCSGIHGEKYRKSAIAVTLFRLVFIFCQVIVMIVLYSAIAHVIYKSLSRIRKIQSTQQKNSNSKVSLDSESPSMLNDTGSLPRKQTTRQGGPLESLQKVVSKGNVYGHFRKHRFTYTFMLLTGVYALNLIPSTVITLLYVVLGEHAFWYRLSYAELQLSLLAFNSDIIDSAIHPFIYGLLDTKLRKEIKRSFKC